VEFSLQAHLSNRFRADASYTWLKATSDGMEAVRRPGNLASFAVTGATADGKGELTLVARYNGRQKDVTFTDPTYITEPIVTLGSYTLINLDGEYRVTGHLSLLGRIENLAGKRYQEVYSFQAGGRGAYAGFRVRF
jgi:vitamin B12 transporter